ncbi:MAG TPA: chorismate mutase [Acidimicrobiales bacterium]|nr:chorismate mutase [Acidimicrobiales bacterium]
MTPHVRAIRGATTLETDSAEEIDSRVRELVGAMLERNSLDADGVISILFTATPDVRSAFPATAARRMGLDGVPVIGAQELDVDGGMSLCVRVMMHVETELPRERMEHVYLHRAASLQATGGRSAGADAAGS